MLFTLVTEKIAEIRKGFARTPIYPACVGYLGFILRLTVRRNPFGGHLVVDLDVEMVAAMISEICSHVGRILNIIAFGALRDRKLEFWQARRGKN